MDDFKEIGRYIFYGSLIFAAMLGGIYIVSHIPEYTALKKCDAAIQATLKAPSTFRRISYNGSGSDGDYSFTISYDAANGFGVPIRGRGRCFTDRSSGAATWFELAKI